MSDSVLSIRGVSKHFGALVACDDVSLDVAPGQIHALIGPNGAGKSTLINLISGQIAPDAGSVLLEGAPIEHLSVPERARRGLGRSFQISALALEATAEQNVLMARIGRSQTQFSFFRSVARDAELREDAHQRLARVGLADAAHTLAGALSHGQRRLLEIAVALALCPKVFLLDEPMAGLGATGSAELTSFLDGLRAEAPIFLVEHDMDAVFALADRISVLVYGKVIASGTPDEIRASQEVQEAYLGAPSTDLTPARRANG